MVLDAVSHLQAACRHAGRCNPSLAFVPGSYWTTHRARAAVAAALYAYHDKGGRLALQQAILSSGAPHTPSAVPERAPSGSPVVIRRATCCDVEAVSDVLRASGLMPWFVQEFIQGFVVAEQDGEIVGCAGLEPYETAGMIRSVAVLPSMAGRGLGKLLIEAVIADARASGLLDLYLFTADAHPFWSHLGFIDVPFERWDPSTRSAWQVNFVSDHPEFFASLSMHAMWLPLVGNAEPPQP